MMVIAPMSLGGGYVQANGGIDIGGIALIPRLDVQAGHDDNIFEDSINEQSSSFIQATPSIELKAQQGLDSYSLILDAVANRYSSVSEADHTDATAALSIHKEFTSRNRIDLNASIARLNDLDAQNSLSNNVPGRDIVAEPEPYTRKAADLVYGFGKSACCDIFFLPKSLVALCHPFSRKHSNRPS